MLTKTESPAEDTRKGGKTDETRKRPRKPGSPSSRTRWPPGAQARLRPLFHADSYWRDVLALTWRIATFAGAEAIVDELAARPSKCGPADGFAIDAGRTAPRWVMRAGADAIETIFRFETRAGRGSGVLRLTPDVGDGGKLKAWTLLTALDEIKGHEEKRGHAQPGDKTYSRDFRGPNWLDIRKATAAYADRDPTVLVIGGGQAGLSAAACLGQLGVDTLIVDRWPRIGDNWRKRYHALVLHNQMHVNHLPYMRFPPNWPAYIPKDKIAGWFEAYVESMELNYWPATTFEGGELRRNGGAMVGHVTQCRRRGARRCSRATSSWRRD